MIQLVSFRFCLFLIAFDLNVLIKERERERAIEFGSERSMNHHALRTLWRMIHF